MNIILSFLVGLIAGAIIGAAIGIKISTLTLKIKSLVERKEKFYEKEPEQIKQIPAPNPEDYKEEQWAIIEQDIRDQEAYVTSKGYPPGTNFYDVCNAEQNETETDPEERRVIYSGKAIR